MSTSDSPTELPGRQRPRIAFFGYPDVFEDFYPQYGVDQQAFATHWACTGNHAFVAVLQEAIGDVTWYEHSVKPEVGDSVHLTIGCRVKFFRSSLPHRLLWSAFYLPKCAWRWRRFYRAYATVAAYLAPLSIAFLRALKKDRPDYIFVQDYCSGRFDILVLLARWLDVPLFAYHAGSTPERYLGPWVRRLTLPRADKLLASNLAEAKKLAMLYRIPPGRLEVIMTPINPSVFHPMDRTAACATFKLDPGRRYLLYLGRLLDPVKRVSSILRAFSSLIHQYDDVDLLVAGAGPDEEALKMQATALSPERIRFLGWVSDDAGKNALYNVAECLVLPSLREGFPTVVGEALSCGTPVLGSKLDGIVELITPGINGWLITPGDDQELLSALASVLEDPEKVRLMRAAAHDTAIARVSPRTIAGQLRDCFFPDSIEPHSNPMSPPL